MSAATGAGNQNPNKNPHILVFPYPAQGHMLALLDLTHQLCRRHFSVSVVVTPRNLPFLSPLLSAHPSAVSAVTFPFPPHPSLPSGVEHVQDIGNSGNLPIMTALHQLREPIVLWFRSHPNPPIALISDFFLGWTNDLCRQIGIPRFSFFSSGAFLASVVDFCFNNLDSLRSTDTIQFSDLPRGPVFREEHLPSMVRRYIRSTSPDLKIIKDGVIENFQSYGCIFNSFETLEGEYFEYVKQKVGHDRVYGVGPLCLLGLDPTDRGKRGSDPDSGMDTISLLTWLDECPDRSVLYVCFGSQKALTKEQCEALALGLENSMTRFVWVTKTDQIPDGFEDRVAGRGVVFKGWAPQVDLLGHRAVGGFLSHCGWNSVLEAISSQTMILAWPMEADQFVNARILVEHMGMAVNVWEGGETVPDPDELGRAIAEAMGDGGRQANARAEEIRKKAITAVEPGGSSLADLDRLVKGLRSL